MDTGLKVAIVLDNWLGPPHIQLGNKSGWQEEYNDYFSIYMHLGTVYAYNYTYF
jgi:hypothetical protein